MVLNDISCWTRQFTNTVYPGLVIPIIYKILKITEHLKKLKKTRFFYVILVFLTTWIISALLFYYSERVVAGRDDVDLWTSLYWSIITMSTIGYGDVTPVKGLGWIVAGFTAVAGIAVYTLTVSVIADWFLSSSIRRSLGMAPLKNKEILVIGDSDSCLEIIDELVINNYGEVIGLVTPVQPKTAIEVDYLVGDPEDENVLVKAGIEKAKHVFLCLDDDSKTLHVALLIKHLNKKCNIYAIASRSKTESLLKEIGVKHVVSNKLLGRALASAVFEPSVLTILSDIVSRRGKGDLMELRVDDKLHGHTIREVEEQLSKKDRHTYRVIGLFTSMENYVIAPDPDTRVKKGQVLVLVKSVKE